MGSNPINLAVRFILELMALFLLGLRGWTVGEGLIRYVWMITLPIGAAALWGIFRVPGDPSSSGKAPVRVPGWIRLILELTIFAAATLTLSALDKPNLGIAFGVIVGLHYLLSWDRILWLLRS